MTKCFCLIFIIAAISATAFAQEQYLMPVDEGQSNPSLAAFRTKLIAAVKRKDAKYVLSVLDPKVKIDFGGGAGIVAFKKEWENLGPESRFWAQFLPVISNGGAFSDETEAKEPMFWAPYVFGSFPSELDAFEHAAIIGKDVHLRAKPSLKGDIVAKLSFNIVKIDPDELDVPDEGMSPAEMAYTGRNPEPFFWVKVTTLGGKTGYVKDEYVRRPVDYRAGFEKKRGVWKLVAFIAGD